MHKKAALLVLCGAILTTTGCTMPWDGHKPVKEMKVATEKKDAQNQKKDENKEKVVKRDANPPYGIIIDGQAKPETDSDIAIANNIETKEEKIVISGMLNAKDDIKNLTVIDSSILPPMDGYSNMNLETSKVDPIVRYNALDDVVKYELLKDRNINIEVVNNRFKITLNPKNGLNRIMILITSENGDKYEKIINVVCKKENNTMLKEPALKDIQIEKKEKKYIATFRVDMQDVYKFDIKPESKNITNIKKKADPLIYTATINNNSPAVFYIKYVTPSMRIVTGKITLDPKTSSYEYDFGEDLTNKEIAKSTIITPQNVMNKIEKEKEKENKKDDNDIKNSDNKESKASKDKKPKEPPKTDMKKSEKPHEFRKNRVIITFKEDTSFNEMEGVKNLLSLKFEEKLTPEVYVFKENGINEKGINILKEKLKKNDIKCVEDISLDYINTK